MIVLQKQSQRSHYSPVYQFKKRISTLKYKMEKYASAFSNQLTDVFSFLKNGLISFMGEKQ